MPYHSRKLDEVFQALADPARFRIVEAMKSGECAVGDIVERMDIQQSGVSRHLRILTEAAATKITVVSSRRATPCSRISRGRVEAMDARPPFSRPNRHAYAPYRDPVHFRSRISSG